MSLFVDNIATKLGKFLKYFIFKTLKISGIKSH